MTHIPTFWRALWYLVLLAALTLATVLYTLTWSRGSAFENLKLGKGSLIWSDPSVEVNNTKSDVDLPPDTHLIEHLITLATSRFKKITNNQIHTLDQAAAQYRKLRGRHPPPGFDKWYAYTSSHNAIINEKFWDQIYDDLAPFWSIQPVTLREQAHVFSPKISIRDGKVEAKSHNAHSKLGIWQDMFVTLASETDVRIPDIDIPLNVNDEVAMLVPWENIDTKVSMGRKMMLEPGDVVSNYSGLGDIESLTEHYEWQPEWLGPRLTHPSSHLGPRPLWSLLRPACPPKTPARSGKVYNDIWDPEGGVKDEHEPAALLPIDLPAGTLKGYVKNWTSAIDVCQQPELQGLHSAFVSPENMGVARKLFPLFGDTKLAMSNEILLPSAEEWNVTKSMSSSTLEPWDEKEDKLYWRGASTVARDPERYWRRFQRERLVSMLNATHVEIAEASIHTGNESTVGVGYASNFRLLPANEYHLKSQSAGGLAEWVNSWADTAFTDLSCAGAENGCEEFFSNKHLRDEDEAKAKFGIAIDSSSLSRQLSSGKVTLRTGINRQWYDARLVPWKHYIPLSNTLTELYAIMQFFIGSRVDPNAPAFPHAVGHVQAHEHHFKTPENAHESHLEDSGNLELVWPPLSKRSGHEDAARRIAEAGNDWAGKVLRKEDILIYVYRLLLEYARVLDDGRDRLGWVRDLQ